MGDRANAIHTITTCGYFVIRIYPFHLLCATRANEPKPHMPLPICEQSNETKKKHTATTIANEARETFKHFLHHVWSMNELSDYPRSLVNLSLFEL